jgi:hypothetical protein
LPSTDSVDQSSFTPDPVSENEKQSINKSTEKVSEVDAVVPTTSEKSEKKPKTRKRKFKPMLVKRLKLDANGDMVPDEALVAENDPEDPPEELPEMQEIHVTETPQVLELAAEITEFIEPEEQLPIEAITESDPVTPPQNEFDGVAFLNSLDLEKLVLVESQKDGKDVYEIHEIDPETQEMFENPIDLPARYVDLIISVMTQQDDDE